MDRINKYVKNNLYYYLVALLYTVHAHKCYIIIEKTAKTANRYQMECIRRKKCVRI